MTRFIIITVFALVCQLQSFANEVNPTLEGKDPVNIQDYKKSLQLNQKELAEKTTGELLDLCLNYPYIIDCLFYNGIEEGVDELILEYNGFSELLSRNDAINTMLSRLQLFSNEFNELQHSDSVMKGMFSFKNLVLEMLIAKESEKSELSIEQKRIIMNVMDSCLSVKVQYPKTFGSLCRIPYLLIERQLSSDGMSSFLRSNPTPTTIHTPKGSIVPDTYTINENDHSYSSDELAALQSSLYINYDGAELIAPPSKKYNCHAYAWHISEGGGQVWLGYYTNTAENVYWTDGSYKEVPESLSTKVSYHESTANHSAVRINSTWYQSKWGEGPLVKHHPNACPYNTSYPKKYYRKSPVLVGPSYVYESASFTANNIITGSTLTWTLSGSNASCFVLEPGVPSTNNCTITRNDSVEFNYPATNLTLTAIVTYGGILTDTISKQFIAPFIEGPAIPCDHTEYTVINRPDNSTVTWSTIGQGIGNGTDPNWMLEVDPNDYVIANYDDRYIYGTLTANVIVGNQSVGVLHKHVDTTGGFSGTWYQQPSLLDSTNATPRSFSHMSILEIVPGRKVYLVSNDFIGTTITHSETGFTISNWSNSNGVISFTPRASLNNNSGSIIIRGNSSSDCRSFSFSLRRPLLPILLNASLSEGVCQFSISENEDAISTTDTRLGTSPEWRLSIIRNDTGKTVYESFVAGRSKTVGIIGWDSGIYLAIAQVDGISISCKFTINK